MLQKIVSILLALLFFILYLVSAPFQRCFTDDDVLPGRSDWSAEIVQGYDIVRVNSRSISIGKAISNGGWQTLIERYFLIAFCVK